MVLPIVGIAAGVAARAAAKKAATSAVKKVATKKAAAKVTAKKRVAATYTPTKKAVPAKVVKKTTPPIVKQPSLENLLKENYAKALKITKARGGDPKSVSVTIDGKTIDYKGIR
jgi:hypothetical protein